MKNNKCLKLLYKPLVVFSIIFNLFIILLATTLKTDLSIVILTILSIVFVVTWTFNCIVILIWLGLWNKR